MFDNFATGPTGFIGHKLYELRPTGVGYGFRQVMISDHALDAEVFQTDDAKAVDDLPAQLVMEVTALVCNLFVRDGHGAASFSTTIAALNLAAQAALPDLQPAFRFAQVLGWGNFLARAECGKGGQAKVNSDAIRLLLRGGVFNFALDGNKEFAGLGFRHGAILHFPFNAAVTNDFHPTDLWQIDFIAVQFKPLRVAHGLFGVFALEFWVVGAARKEVYIGAVKVFQDLLQRLTIRIFQPRVFRLEPFGKVGRAIVVIQAGICFLIVFFPHGAVVVVNKARIAKLAIQFIRLVTIRVAPKLESLFHSLNVLLIFDVLFDYIQRNSTNGRDELATRPQVRQAAF